MIKGGLITEKFALLNLLQALGQLSKPSTAQGEAENISPSSNGTPPAPSAPSAQQPPHNMMQAVLERHERIANKLKQSGK
ncbi:MAG: hypothetical protein K2K60_03840 [Clostridia bacterium]|nr:hypothetical protein [Clostridia bacterium]